MVLEQSNSQENGSEAGLVPVAELERALAVASEALENACKYEDDKTKIEVRLQRAEEQVRVHPQDLLVGEGVQDCLALLRIISSDTRSSCFELAALGHFAPEHPARDFAKAGGHPKYNDFHSTHFRACCIPDYWRGIPGYAQSSIRRALYTISVP